MSHDALPRPIRRAALAGVAVAALAGAAQAQTFSTNSAQFNGGYGRYQGSENQPIDVSSRDENGNRVIVDGIIEDGDASTTTSTGEGTTWSGAGSRFSNATAIGNNLQVITQGSYNTVIVNSTQINNGDVTASNNGDVATDDGSLNGELDPND